MIERISSSFIFNDDSLLSILMARGFSLFTNRGSIEGVFLLLKQQINFYQYVLCAIFLLNALIYFF